MGEFIEVAKTGDISVGQIKDFKVGGKEILIANVDGNFYAISNRCGHMNAPLSMGTLKGTEITCPFHGAKFDVTTGKKVSEPHVGGMKMENLPEELVAYMKHAGKIMAKINTYDQRKYEVKTEDGKIKVKI